MSKLKIDRELFHEKLSKVIKFVPSRTLTPALDNVKLSVVKDRMEILASDGSIQCKLYCPVESKEDITICLPAKFLISIVALFRENEITITVKDKGVEIKNGKAKYKVGMDTMGNEFPIMPMAQATSEINMQQFILKQAFTSAEKFVNEKNPLPQMIGVCMLEKENRIIFTGAEQQIMCRVSSKPISINKWDEIVVPPDTANKVVGMLEDKGEINVIHSGDKIVFYTTKDEVEEFEITSVLHNMKFPDSEMVFSKKTPENVICNTLEIKDALRRLRLSCINDIPVVRMQSNPDNLNEILLTSGDDLTNKSGEEIVTVNNVSGLSIDKGFNIDQLLKILGSFDENEFSFFYNENHKKPSMIEPLLPTARENMFSFLVSSIKL